MTTIHELRRLAISRDVRLELDEDCQCYRATAKPGQRFEVGLHELIGVFGGGIIGNGGTKAEAREDLADRLRSCEGETEQCDDPHCDWCSHAE